MRIRKGDGSFNMDLMLHSTLHHKRRGEHEPTTGGGTAYRGVGVVLGQRLRAHGSQVGEAAGELEHAEQGAAEEEAPETRRLEGRQEHLGGHVQPRRDLLQHTCHVLSTGGDTGEDSVRVERGGRGLTRASAGIGDTPAAMK